MKIIASLGGGFTSSALMPRILLKNHSKRDIEFVNCVLPNEHSDMWKLFDAVEERLKIAITHIAYDVDNKYRIIKKEDRSDLNKLWTPFDIFMKKGFIANSRLDPCSSILKRETIFNYISDKYSSKNCIIAVGIHADEFDRSIAIRENWEDKGYETYFPLLYEPSYSREDQILSLKEWYGVRLDLYEKGFDHNNCGGACVKAGQRQWARLWYYYPEVYDDWERQENEWNKVWSERRGREHTILRVQREGKRQYISLKYFREKILEPAYSGNLDGFISEFLQSLPGNPGCMWCSAI